MRLIMDDRHIQTVEQVQDLLEGSHDLEFKVPCGEERYEWTESVLRRFKYPGLGRTGKGLIRCYLGKMTGYSRAQVCRLIGEYRRAGELRKREYHRHRFAATYSRADMELLAKTDELHDYLSGPATKRILERECRVYGRKEFENIAKISVAHLYNLRKRNIQLGLARRFTKTRPVALSIGERAAPDPKGQPGYLRIDTVHQGDLDGEKGVYHINAVDQATQWEIVASVERISEAYLVPALEIMLSGFPFVISGFHSDNGSEFINYQIAALLNKMFIRFTKSRPRHCNDNALAESKNGSVLRKHLGYSHIPQRYAEELNAYYTQFLNPYVNFHRPCFFPISVIDSKGKVKKKYPYEEVMTPYERLSSVPGVERYLTSGITLTKLEAVANEMSDNTFAERMAEARSDLFQRISYRENVPPELKAYPLIHTIHKERKSSKKKERLATARSGSFFD